MKPESKFMWTVKGSIKWKSVWIITWWCRRATKKLKNYMKSAKIIPHFIKLTFTIFIPIQILHNFPIHAAAKLRDVPAFVLAGAVWRVVNVRSMFANWYGSSRWLNHSRFSRFILINYENFFLGAFSDVLVKALFLNPPAPSTILNVIKLFKLIKNNDPS